MDVTHVLLAEPKECCSILGVESLQGAVLSALHCERRWTSYHRVDCYSALSRGILLRHQAGDGMQGIARSVASSKL